MPSGSLGGNKNEFSVIDSTHAKDAGYTIFDAYEKLIQINPKRSV